MRTLQIGGENRGAELEELFGCASTYQARLIRGGSRLAVWIRDEEHDRHSLIVADADTGEVIEHFWDVAPEYGGSITVCQDGARIVYQGEDLFGWGFRDETDVGWVDTDSVPTGFTALPPDVTNLDDFPTRVSASPDGQVVVKVGTQVIERNRRTTRRTWVESWKLTEERVPVPGPGIPLSANLPHSPMLAVSGGEQPLVAIVGQGRLVVWNLATQTPTLETTIPGYDGSMGQKGVVFAEDGSRFFLIGKRVFTWATADWSPIELPLPMTNLLAVDISPSGTSLIATDVTGIVRFFDTTTGTEVRAIEPPIGQLAFTDIPSAVSFSPDGTMCLMMTCFGTVAIWDVE